MAKGKSDGGTGSKNLGRRPTEIDQQVADKIRLRRKILGLNQHELAARLNISTQQFQKYETGDNRVSASRLYALASALLVPVSWFFEESDANRSLQHPMEEQAPTRAASLGHVQSDCETDAVLQAYFSITNEQDRREVLELLGMLSKQFQRRRSVDC